MSTQESQPNQASARPPGTPVMADVFARPRGGGGIAFSLEWRFEGDGGKHNGPIDLPAKKAADPGTPIHFQLRDETDRKLRFDPADPIWVSRIQCPYSPSSDPEIPTDQVKGNPNLLKVLDINKDQCELHYTLLFRDGDGKLEPYDPMIRNGGTI